MGRLQQGNHFQHHKNHFFLIKSHNPHDEERRIEEALTNLAENIITYFQTYSPPSLQTYVVEPLIDI